METYVPSIVRRGKFAWFTKRSKAFVRFATRLRLSGRFFIVKIPMTTKQGEIAPHETKLDG